MPSSAWPDLDDADDIVEGEAHLVVVVPMIPLELSLDSAATAAVGCRGVVAAAAATATADIDVLDRGAKSKPISFNF